MSKEEEIGILIIVVLKARNLNDKHSFYKQDVFAQATLNGVTKKTHVDVKGGQHPVWDVELRFPILRSAAEKNRKLEVSCFAKEHRSDDLLGKGSVDVSETLKTGEFDDWVPLSVEGVSRGDVYLEMTYYAAGHIPSTYAKPLSPAPTPGLVVPTVDLNRRPSKMAQAERLSRLSDLMQTPNGQKPRPSSSSTSSSPPPRQQSPLSPVRNGAPSLPSALAPGGGPRIKPQVAESVPAFLRPGSNKAVGPIPTATADNPYLQQKPAAATPTFSVQAPIGDNNPYVRPATVPPPTTDASPWASIGSPISFPIAMPSTPVPTTQPPTQTPVYQPYQPPVQIQPPPVQATSPFRFQSPPPFQHQSTPPPFLIQSPPPPPLPHHHHSGSSSGPDPRLYYGNASPFGPPPPQPPSRDSGLPDPYLIARYHTPLPLPPGGPPPPPPQSTTISSLPSPYPSQDDARLARHRQAESDAARRKAQEEADMELARKLDLELNV